MEAVISECGTYRYTLMRELGGPMRFVKPVLFIMLNPSTADAKLDDPTINKCKRFAYDNGGTELTVVNLFALRATDPKELTKHQDPEGPDNYVHLWDQITLHEKGLIIVAWGNHKMAVEKGRDLISRMRYMGITPMCLGVNKNGTPKHPLYIPYSKELEQI
jgi:hypothetical protein